MGSVLLATDGSDLARPAGRRALDLARGRGVPLHVLCVVDRRRNDEPGLSSGELQTIVAEDEGHRCIQDLEEMAAGWVDVRGAVRHGVPHELILDYADDADADTIVVGAHGNHRSHLGGVARRVERETDREVVVVDAGRRLRSS